MKLAPLALLIAALCAHAARAESPPADAPHAVGAALEPLELADQHGKTHGIDAARRALLFTRDMDAGEILKQALADGGAQLLEGAGAAYVADVSGMPALILRLFALRKMRERPYPMLLDRSGEATARWPAQAGKITYLVLDGLRIAELRYLGTAEEVRAALAPPPAE